MAWPLILMAAGAIGQGYAQSQADKSAANAARLSGVASRISTMLKVQDLKDAEARLESTQRAMYAKSGVDITSGSAAEVQASSARDIEKEIYRIKYTGDLQYQSAMSAEDAFSKAANYALAGGFLKGGALAYSGWGKLQDIKVKPNTPVTP